MRLGKTKVAKKNCCAKKAISIWDVVVNNTVISNLIERNYNSKYLIGYLDEVIRSLVLILPKMSGYVKTFKDKDGNKDNKLTSFRIADEKALKKYKAIWTKIEDLKSITLNVFLFMTIYVYKK